ncbi:tuliposide A-converting enzyme b1, amyloplastic-like [Panicum miliaceum]|uniref:Tuliposide A-converting enzyme b1, amyloplastic-like n=1 Tax=Panicum miliaceum TaxID=4540 RepID=A0A3L6T8Q3_PANMI|nr:tuliposide A-converting enzyme b1, amyloplastic-like [Panicum miliaceum]
MDSASSEVAFECGCFLLHSDGRVERTGGVDTVPAGFDADTGVTSKDVVVDAATGLAARLYLPAIPTAAPLASEPGGGGAATKLPVLVIFHGGYFVVGSPGCPDFHGYVNSLVAAARVVAVSVDYRLAPEHPLPAGYDDSWAALTWAASGADPCLSDHGDLGRVFVAGASAGANIAHNMAIAAGTSATPALARIEGVILLHPSFRGERKLEDEAEEFWRPNKKRWAVIFPGARDGSDDPRINPMTAGAPGLAKLAGKRLFVSTASEDPRAPRGRAYCEAVRTSGWPGEVEWFESKGEGHAFFVFDHGSHEAVALMDRVVAFVAGH